MKKTWMTQALFTSCLTIATAAHAVNPETGWYGGLIVGANYLNNLSFDYIKITSGELTPGQLGHNIMASIGGQAGYRWCDNYRFEGELIFNNSPYSYLRLGDVTIHSPSTSTELRLKGQSQSVIGTFNVFYDVFADFSSNVVPYLGLGLGYGYVSNKINFYYNDELLRYQVDLENIVGVTPEIKTKSGLVGQAIVGISYYMDDFSYFALDGRYLVSGTQSVIQQQIHQTTNVINARYQLYSLNIIFNGAFDGIT